MPRLAAYGLAILAFTAGFVLAGTLAFTYRPTAAAPIPSPTALAPCSGAVEDTLEFLAMAGWSHNRAADYLEENIRTGLVTYTESAAELIARVEWERGTAAVYAAAVDRLAGECIPATTWPRLEGADLPPNYGAPEYDQPPFRSSPAAAPSAGP